MGQTKHTKAWIFLIFAVLLGAVLIFVDTGTLQYIAFRSHLTAPIRLGEVVLTFKDDWYKKVSSEGVIGRFVIKSEDPKVIVASRDGVWNSDSVQAILTRIKPREWEATTKTRKASEKLEKFPWGNARILEGEFIAEIPEYCITVAVVDWRKGPSVRTVLDALIKVDLTDDAQPHDPPGPHCS